MKKDNPANRPFLNATAFVILLPLLALVILLPLGGMFDSIRMLFGHGRWFDYPIVIFLSGFYITSAALILWRSRLSWGLSVFYLAFILMFLYTVLTLTKRDVDSLGYHYALEIGLSSHIHGVDVYCNDVHLGQTPLVISEKDFRRKVKPWNQPPRQEILIGSQWIPYDSYSNKFFYIPNDYFERYRQNRQILEYRDRDASRELLRTSRYWWRFEKNGYVGVTPIESYFGGGCGRTIITIYANPKVMYPSVEPHLELLLHSLRNSNYEPTDEWMAHFRKYSELLFHKLYQKTQHDPRLTRALHALVKTEFSINDRMSEKEVARVIDEIMASVERVGAFTIPSPESVAIDLLGQRASKAVEKRIKLADAPSWRGGWRSGIEEEKIMILSRRGRAVRFFPLEYAIQQIRPPALFNRLVYESRRGSKFIGLVGNYRGEEAARLVRHYLQDTANARGINNISRVHQTMEIATQIHNPTLEEDFRRFVRDNIGLNYYFPFETFIESRLKSPVTSADSLAQLIFDLRFKERDKLKYLSKVNSPRTYSYIKTLILDSTSKQKEVIQYLEKQPNPALDQFLIDSYEYLGTWETLTQAMLVCDTPEMRAYLDKLWDEDTYQREMLLDAMSKMEQGSAHLTGWLQTISEITEPSLRLLAVPVLSRIDTPEAVAILELWAAEPDAQLRTAAQEHLDEYQKRGRQVAELISGKIKPDDLLPTQTPYVWNGEDYVPEL